MGNIAAIVGRPNVGKSTFFNRLLGERKAIIDDQSGVTRDRQYGASYWNGKNFTVIDTGGFVENSDDVFEAAIRDQVYIAIEEATVIVFMVDVATGITDLDEQVANILRQSNKPVLLMVNKVDNSERQLEANEFWSLGFEHTFFVSSITGSGTGDILDELVEHIDEDPNNDSEIPKIAILGQPNVGKSSLTNALLGEERTIVTDQAGTTRDTIHTHYKKFDKEFFLIDTAGIRRKKSVKENLEFYSVMRAINALEECDVCLLMIDASVGIEGQDLKILSLALKRKKGLVILVNKWDLVEKDSNTTKEYELKIKERIAPFTDVPIVFTSVLEKQRISKALDLALQVHQNRIQKIPTSKLNEIMLEEIEKQPAPAYRSKFIKIKYVTQLPMYYPSFAFYCNYPKHVREPYKKFLENKLRQHFNLTGVPINIFMREK